jgi:hypothetical protein
MKSMHLLALFAILVAVLFRFSEKAWEGPTTQSQNY